MIHTPRISALVFVWAATQADFAHSQSPTPAPIPLPIVLSPATGEPSTPTNALRWLDGAVRAALPHAGLAAFADFPFLLNVSVTTREVGRSDAGMQTVVLTESAVTFDLRSGDGRFTVGSARVVHRGGGRDFLRAAEISISGASQDQPGLDGALSKIAQQASTAYESSCDAVLTAARARALSNLFNEAIAIVMSVPAAAAHCRARARWLASTLYLQRSHWACGMALRQARAARAAGDLTGALDHVKGVDPLSPCTSQAEQLINEVGREAASQRATEVQERVTAMQQQAELTREALRVYTTIEEKRWAVLGDIAKAVLVQAQRR